jgi:hypothetical protein
MSDISEQLAWSEVGDTWMGLEANFEPWCVFHPDKKVMMDVFDTKLLNFYLWDGAERSHAIDVVMYCKHCGYHDTYGVAISPEHFKRQYGKIRWLIRGNLWRSFLRDPFDFIYRRVRWKLNQIIKSLKKLIEKI